MQIILLCNENKPKHLESGGFMLEAGDQSCKLQVLLFALTHHNLSPQTGEAARKVVRQSKLSKLLRFTGRRKEVFSSGSSDKNKNYLA